MAKTTKGGLGRGLNSLISGSLDEALPAEKPQKEAQNVEGGAQRERDEPRRPVAAGVAAPELSQALGKNKEESLSGSTGGVGGVGNIGDTSVDKGSGIDGVSDKSQNLDTPTKKETVTSRDGGFPQRSEARKSFYDEDDHVVIKSVKERIVEEKTRIVDEIELSSIKPNPDQPRTNFKKEELEELAASIEKDGLLQPIVVRPFGNEYQIIAGERRYQACKALGVKEVPVRIREADDDKALELAMVENIHREDLNPIEEAYGYRRLMDRMGLTQGEVAEVVSKGRSTIANAMRLLELPEDAQQLLFEEKISAGHARAILAIPTEEGRQKLTEKMVSEKISVREAETIARLYAGAQNKGANPEKLPAPKSFKMIARSLRTALQTGVRVKSSQGKNKIEIEFKDEEDLQRLFGVITSSEAEK